MRSASSSSRSTSANSAPDRKRARDRDLELEAGARAHYDDPTYYTATYRRRIDDVQFYVDEALKAGGPVLEYGGGNGRIALPIARHGLSITCVDWSRAMTGDLRARIGDESREVRERITIVRGDMRRVKLAKKFPLVLCTFNTALHLYTRDDVEKFFARVRAHMTPRGRFVVDLSMPALGDLVREPGHAYHVPRFRHPSDGRVVKNREYFDYDRARQILFVSAEFEPIDDPSAAWSVPLAHRQFFPREWEALLHYNGFDVERVSGDFYGGPLTRDSDVMVWRAKLRRGAK